MGNPFKSLGEDKRPVAKTAAKKETKMGHKVASREEEHLFDESGNINPRSHGGSGRMFNSEGQVNAYDKKDALTQTWSFFNKGRRYASIKEHGEYKPTEFGRELQSMSKEAQREVLAAALNDPTGEGFRIVGEEIALPIKAILDYEGFSRKIFRVKKLAQAELFRVPKDVRAVAYVMGGDGQTPEARIKTKWITPEENSIKSFPTIDVADLHYMNFDVLDRAQDTARQEIELQEDKLGIDLLDSASQAVNTVTTYATLGVSAFEDVRYQVERHRLVVSRFLINRAEMSDIIKTMSSAVDPVTERELLLSGYIGNFMGADILTASGIGVEEVIPAGTFYACTEPDNLGVMGERISLTVSSFNKFAIRETVKGWAIYEQVGFVIPNSRAVAKGTK